MLRFVLIFVLCMSPILYAMEDIYQFTTEQQRQQFDELTHELRCLVCQNQNLADSNAPLAQDFRDQIYHMLMAGKQPQQIRTYLTERYGDFVLYKPPVQANTVVLWLAPFALMFISLIFAVRTIAKQREQSKS